ncbi:putative Protein kinase domain-containing protein [Seiridium unicorne]|uniref:Protein kinase domain-containing protein n=1 Tax=Seiridium unicorne TaxID=138068 RepID=A0ABR2UT03_9PEZI
MEAVFMLSVRTVHAGIAEKLTRLAKVLRGCVALAFPPGWPTNTDLAPETWPDGITQALQIAHNDIHSENVAFGDFTDEKEHDLSPILKILDFGSARVHDLSNPEEKTEFESRDFDATDVFSIGKI